MLGSNTTFTMYPIDYMEYLPNYGCWVHFIEETSGSTSYWLFGDNFLRAYYQVYDMDGLKIGLAPADAIRNGNFGVGDPGPIIA